MIQADAVVEAIGNFGPWQAQSLFLLALVKIPAGWHMLSILFLAPQPETFGGQYWCLRPDPDLDVQQWIEDRHPQNTKYVKGYDPCYISKENLTLEIDPIFQQQNIKNENNLHACKNFEFKVLRPTMVSEFSLVCDRDYLVNVVQLSYLLGILLGGIFTWLLLQRLSPRKILFCGAALQIVAGTGSALVPLYEQHCFLKFLTGFGVCLMFTAGHQISVDITAGWQRTVIGVSYEHFWSIGVISLGWINELSASWRVLQIIISVPTIIVFLFFWAIPDSPRWLISQGKIEKADELLIYAAHANGRTLRPDFTSQKSAPRQHEEKTEEKKNDYYQINQIFCVQLLWIVTIFNYYGALLNIRNVGAMSLAIRTTLAGSAELFGATIGLYLLLRMKFKFGILSLMMLISGSCCVASWAITPDVHGNRRSLTMLCLALTGRISISCSMAMLSNGACAQFLPVASERPLIMMIIMSIGRLCLQTAPFMNSLSKIADSITLSVYGTSTLIGSVASLMLFLLAECRQRRKK